MKKLMIVLSALLFLLAGCANLRPAAPSSLQPTAQTWQQRSAQLTRLNNWTILGAISIHQPQRTTIAHLQWQQHQRNYDIHLTGPFSVGGVHITGGIGYVTLAGVQKGAVEVASSPEALVRQQLGVELPISNMYYWVRGLPAPGVTAKQTLDNQNRLALLQQQNWTIRYQAYQTVNGIDLPSTIIMTNEDLSVKLVIKQWIIGADSR